MLWVSSLLALAIVTEVAGTAVLPRTEGFTVPLWSVVVVAAYAVSAWLLALVVRHLDVGIVYAVWSGAGTAGIVLVGAVALGQVPNPLQIVAVSLIVIGVVMLNLQGAH